MRRLPRRLADGEDAESRGDDPTGPAKHRGNRFVARLAIGIFLSSLVAFCGFEVFMFWAKPEEPDFKNPVHLLELYQDTLVLTQLLEEFGVHYWAHDGMLIGAYRSRGILPHDDDADIGITRSDMEAKMDTAVFRAAAEQLGYRLSERVGAYFGWFKFYKINSAVTNLRWGWLGWISVDIFPFDDQNLALCEDLWLRAPPNGMIKRHQMEMIKDFFWTPSKPTYTRNSRQRWNEDMEWHRYPGGWPSVLQDEAERQQEKWTSIKNFEPSEFCLPPMFGWPRNGRGLIRAKHALPFGGKAMESGNVGSPKSDMYPYFRYWPYGAFRVLGLKEDAAEEYLKMRYGPDVTTHKHAWDHKDNSGAEIAVKLEASDREPRQPFLPMMWPVFTDRQAIMMSGELHQRL